MGLASYREDIWNRFLENVEARPAHDNTEERTYPCPYCSDVFGRERVLIDHLELHRAERPVLLLRGLEPSRRDFVRYRPHPESIRLVNCTMARVRIDGAAPIEMTADRLSFLLAQQDDAVVELQLLNRFEPLAEPIIQPYCLTISVPGQRALDEVDRAFREYLATGSPRMAHVGEFLRDSRCHGIARDYADALATYVRGVLVRDQAPGTGVTLPPAEAADLYGSALERLKTYRRPLPTVVCAFIRFAKNDFSDGGQACGVTRLDRARDLLFSLASDGLASAERDDEESGERTIALCPIDQGIDRVLDLAQRLRRLTRWGWQTAEECRQAADAGSLEAADRDKILALWAVSALRLNAAQDAKIPLRRLRNTFPFETWADKQLDRMRREPR